MKWTNAQQQTIEIRNKNILVSAAAGSGKTAVLIERIKQLIIKDKVDMDKFLITTFTNAAAAEMKERLEKAIRTQMKESDADRIFLKKQLELMSSANISTFHTFALDVIRRYFYLTDLEPGFRIGDDIQISIIKRDAMDKLFEMRFENDYEKFGGFLRKYSSDRNERKIKDNILSLYNEMRSVPDYMTWAAEKADLLRSESAMEDLGLIDLIAGEVEASLKEATGYYGRAALILREAGVEKLSEKAAVDCRKIVHAKITAGNRQGIYGDVKAFITDPDFNQMRASKEEKENFNTVKEQITALRKKGKSIIDGLAKKYFARSLEEYNKEIQEKYEDTKYLICMIKDFENIFKEMKQEKKLIDFDDVMHYAIDILKDDMAAAEYRDRFDYIFIDEFQDSNMLQETIVQRIAGENNLFMVGDVKQSIYKFRLAEPEIFKRKYALYKMPEERLSVKIDLNNNFRSKRRIADTVNLVFSSIMKEYDEDAMLHCGVDENYPGYESSLHIIEKGENDNIPGSIDPEIKLIGQLITESLGQPIYDVKKGEMREVGYGDIAVLSRNKSSIGEVERYLNNEGIPAYGENTGSYFESVEVQTFINLLKLVDNTRRDIPLISVMRCPVFGFDTGELAKIRIAHMEGSFFDAVVAYENHKAEKDEDKRLRNKVSVMLKKVSFWKEIKDTVTLGELVRRLLYDTGYYDYCSGLPAGNQRISNLRMIVEKAEAFEENNYSGLHGFLSYVKAMRDSKISVVEAKPAVGGDVVNIMTVHKSKGLEFPVVILMGAGRNIRFHGIGSPAAMHKDLGICLPNVNKEEHWHRKTLLQRVTESIKMREEFEEEIRILYVALTRAMDKLIVTGTVKDTSVLEDNIGKKSSFIEMMYTPFKNSKQRIIFYEESEQQEISADINHAGSRAKIIDLLEHVDRYADDEAVDKIDRNFSFVYPYSRNGAVKSKYSVTELNKGNTDIEPDIPLITPKFSTGGRKLDAAAVGTVMHTMMEKLDFKKAVAEGKQYIEETAKGLYHDGTIDDEQLAVIDKDNIAAFFLDDIGIRAAASDRLYKEKEFILLKNVNGSDAIVQGIIDCYFEEDDGIVLIDYKNSYIGNGTSEEDIAARYIGQIELYTEAVESALGKKVKEAYLYLFHLRKFIKTI